jgi:probable F420-dependent oxidoreductase
MKLGLFAIGADMYAHEPATAVVVAQAAELAGWESVWVGEHYALPDPQPDDFFIDPDTAMLDPFIALTNIAAHTTTLNVGTGVIVLPLHNPFHLAKQVVSLDRVAPDRFLFGVGVGYFQGALDAFGTTTGDRGRASDELLASMASIFDDEAPAVSWRDRQTTGLRSEPRPLRGGGPPIHVGGAGTAAFRRAATVGAGWYGWCVPPDRVEAARAGLAEAAETCGRTATIEISITPPLDMDVTRELLARYRDVGVDRLIVMPPTPARTDLGTALDFVKTVATFI